MQHVQDVVHMKPHSNDLVRIGIRDGLVRVGLSPKSDPAAQLVGPSNFELKKHAKGPATSIDTAVREVRAFD